MASSDQHQTPNDPVPAAATAMTAAAPQAPLDKAHATTTAQSHSVDSHDEKTPSDVDLEQAADADIVDFDGPDDPQRPTNWSKKKKWSIIACLSSMCFITPLASSMFAPGIPEVLRDFHSSSTILGAFCVSIYILGYAAGPLLLAPLSEMYGRALVYHGSNILFVVFTIACAVSTGLPMLIVFRFFAGLAGSGCITLFGGTIADLFIQEERGAAMSVSSMGPLLGPTIGPICGGFIAETIGWRWVFWIITIVSGVVTIVYFFVMVETYPLILLQRKAKKLARETGNPHLKAKGDRGETTSQLFARSIFRPLKLLLLSPIVFLLSLYCAIVYGYMYLFFTTFPGVFEGIYGFGQGVVGLAYLGIGIGMLLGLGIVGGASDRTLKKKAAAAGGELKPEYRLPFLIPGAFTIPAGLFIYGWTAQYGVQWMAPIFGTALVGFGIIGMFMATAQYLVDAFPVHAASAMAANTILRSLLGALLPLAGPPLYRNIGLGWGNSLLGFIAVALMGVPFAFLKYGETLRRHPRFQIQL